MFIEDKRIDGHLAERTTRPESKDELLTLMAVYPDPILGTHTWEYRWVQPTAEELAKNPRKLPKLIQGPRAMTLAEVREKTKDFETLSLGELRWLQDRFAVPMLPFDKNAPRKDDTTAIREALLAFVRKNKDQSTKKPEPVTTARNNTKGPVILPSDIAEMEDGQIETEAAQMGAHDEYVKIAGKKIEDKRAWLASKRLHQLQSSATA